MGAGRFPSPREFPVGALEDCREEMGFPEGRELGNVSEVGRWEEASAAGRRAKSRTQRLFGLASWSHGKEGSKLQRAGPEHAALITSIATCLQRSLQASAFRTRHTHCLAWSSQSPEGWICQANEEMEAPKQKVTCLGPRAGRLCPQPPGLARRCTRPPPS